MTLRSVHILNSIRGSMGVVIDDTPPTNHEAYTGVDDALKSIFAFSLPILQAVVEENNKVWGNLTTALSKGEKYIEEMRFDFNVSYGG